jgi:membrane-associated phospholipid phosphatase
MRSAVRRLFTRRALVALVLALLAATPRTAAAAVNSEAFKEPHPQSVYKIWPWVDGAFILGTNLVSAGIFFFYKPTPSCPCDPNSVNSLDRHAISWQSDAAEQVGNFMIVGVVAVPIMLDIVDLKARDPIIEDVVVLAEALSISGALVSISKAWVQRPYPRTYAGFDVGDTTNYASFYSGHTAVAFASLSVAAMTVARRHHSYVLPWTITVVAGSAVGLNMILSGWHFPTDVIVGAVMGTGVGMIVPWMHYREPAIRPAVMVSPNGAPVVGLGGTW